MLVRVLQFLLGAVLAGGGGYLAWVQRADAVSSFPPGPSGLPLLLIAGVLGLTSGVVFLVSAVHPRFNQRRAQAVRSARDGAALEAADAYYSGRDRAVDRDWRSGDIAPLAPPAPPPEPPPPVQPVAAVPPVIVSLESIPPAETPEPATPAKQRTLSIPPAAPEAAPQAPAPAPRPVAQAEPAANGATAPPPSPFPAQVTLAPLPRAVEPPPAPAPPAPPAASVPPVAADGPHAPIRAAINAGKLDEADRMLAAARDTATGMDLALLTALAGDHAAVSGKQSHAKWLWRLALKRFGELGESSSPAAKAVAESLSKPG